MNNFKKIILEDRILQEMKTEECAIKVWQSINK